MRFSAGSTAAFIRWSWTSVMNGCDIRIPEGVRIRIRLFGHYAIDCRSTQFNCHSLSAPGQRVFLGTHDLAVFLEQCLKRCASGSGYIRRVAKCVGAAWGRSALLSVVPDDIRSIAAVRRRSGPDYNIVLKRVCDDMRRYPRLAHLQQIVNAADQLDFSVKKTK